MTPGRAAAGGESLAVQRLGDRRDGRDGVVHDVLAEIVGDVLAVAADGRGQHYPGAQPSIGHVVAQPGGFEQAYNAQAAVDTQSMLIIENHVSQKTNDKQEMEKRESGYLFI